MSRESVEARLRYKPKVYSQGEKVWVTVGKGTCEGIIISNEPAHHVNPAIPQGLIGQYLVAIKASPINGIPQPDVHVHVPHGKLTSRSA